MSEIWCGSRKQDKEERKKIQRKEKVILRAMKAKCTRSEKETTGTVDGSMCDENSSKQWGKRLEEGQKQKGWSSRTFDRSRERGFCELREMRKKEHQGGFF